jgi:KaiC/GvpD/RAD55 family RecA-like ATPase
VNQVLQHKRDLASGEIDNRIVRGLLQLGQTPDDEACWRNWLKFSDYGPFELGQWDSALVGWLSDWYASVGPSQAPTYELAREFFERDDKIEVVARLDETKSAQAYDYTRYESILRAAKEAQEIKRFARLCRDASGIAEHGRSLEKPVDGKRVLRGVQDAARHLAAGIAAMDSTAADGQRRRSLATLDAEVREEQRYARLATGIETLDRALTGGFGRGHVHLVTAPPGNFKSSWLTWLAATFAAAGHPVAYVSADEGPRRTLQRLRKMSADSALPLHFAGTESPVEEEARFVAEEAARLTREAAVAAIKGKRHLPRDVEDDGIIEYHVRTLGLQRTGVLVLDSAQCVRTARSGSMRDEYQRINELMLVVRSVAEKHGLVVVMASEANRSSFRARDDKDNATGLSSGKGSSALEYKADTPMTMRKVKADDGTTVIRAKLEKNREGPEEPEWQMRWDGRTFAEVDVEMPTPVSDSQRVAQVILSSVGSISSTRELYVACAAAGLTKRARVDQALAELKHSGRVRGGGGKPLELVSAVDVVTE